MLPKRKVRPRMNVRESSVIRCPGHLKWVRGHQCVCADCPEAICGGKIEAMHVRIGTDGGTAMKPGDNWTIPGCSWHHAHQHRIGERSFEAVYKIDMKAIAAKLWEISPAGKKWRLEHP